MELGSEATLELGSEATFDWGSDATFQEERREVLASLRDALRTDVRDPDLRAAAGFLLRHLAGANTRTGLAGLTANGVVQFVEQDR